ncbi:hypothetical protein ACFYNO_13115 [Kitasatospora sp. NPDC006697]|uniref:hypothetical protein n=1 Tax=Kitasatospora sp. NPDC006697 TaxID=3364020 RepID=UPI0036A37C43
MSLDEDDLSRILQSSVDELRPPVPEMVAEAGRLGRRRRRVRRTLQATGAAATVAALVAGGALLTGGPQHTVSAAGTPRPHASVGAVSSPTAAASPSPSASATASPSPTPEAATADLSWQAMLKILNDQLPPGGKLFNLNTYAVKADNRGPSHYIELQYDDGQGASTVMVTLSQSLTNMPSGFDTCTGWTGGGDEGPRKPGYLKPSCTLTQLPDGDKLLAYVTGTDVVGLYDIGVKLIRPNGTYLQIVAANATLDQYHAGQSGVPITVTREQPPLGVAGWSTVAESPLWQDKIPQSLADAGVEFAKTVTRQPCPEGSKPGDCTID